jgi:CheY-like chemotaxis protein
MREIRTRRSEAMVPAKKGTPPKKETRAEKRPGSTPASSAKAARVTKSPFEPKHILITDDEQYLRELLASQLQEKGYECVSLASKADAYQWSLSHKPDLIITDINSPGMDGFQFLRLIKSNASTGKVPVVFLTGVASNETAEQAKRLGAAEFVTKPCSLADVQTVVERVLTASAHRRPR